MTRNTLDTATHEAQRFSRKYGTFWYVRKMSNGDFLAYAHSSDDEQTVKTFFCGDEWTAEDEQSN